MEYQYLNPPELSDVAQVILFLISLVGLIFNLVVLYIIRIKKHQALEADTILMALVGIFDLIACLFTIILQIIRWTNGLSLDGSPRWCWFDLIFFSTSTYASLSVTALLSSIRYLVIVRGWKITWKTSLSVASGSLLILWTVLIVKGTLIKLTPMPSGLYCMPIQNNSLNELVILEIVYVILLIPLPAFILVGYTLVTRHYCLLVHKGAAAAATQSNFGYSPSMIRLISNQFSRSQRLKTLKLLVMILLYALAIIPEYTMSLLALFIQITRTSTFDCYAFLFMFSLCLINPIFVLCVHEHSKIEFFELFKNSRLRHMDTATIESFDTD